MGHSCRLNCYLGLSRTLRFLRRRFWWPSKARDAKAFIAASPVCASHPPPASLNNPLDIPRHPWSFLTVNFVTDLPPSEGNNAILNVVDRFSKAAQFIPLTKPPSAAETGDLLVRHIFCLHSSTVSGRILCQTKEPNLHPKSEELSMHHWEPQ